MTHGRGPAGPVWRGEDRAGGRTHRHSHDTKSEALRVVQELLRRQRKRRPPGATWVSLGEAISEAILRRFGD